MNFLHSQKLFWATSMWGLRHVRGYPYVTAREALERGLGGPWEGYGGPAGVGPGEGMGAEIRERARLRGVINKVLLLYVLECHKGVF